MTRARLIWAAAILLILAIVGNAVLGAKNYSSANDAINGLRASNHQIAKLSAANTANLDAYKRLSAQRRAENRRTLARLKAETAANHALTLRVSRLAAQRLADNAAAIRHESSLSSDLDQQVSELAAQQATITQDQKRIAALQASQHEGSLRAQYDTCVQVNHVKAAVLYTLQTIFAGFHLTSAQQRKLDNLEAQFKPSACHKP